jgi:predicted outer membrane repeat protein
LHVLGEVVFSDNEAGDAGGAIALDLEGRLVVEVFLFFFITLKTRVE